MVVMNALKFIWGFIFISLWIINIVMYVVAPEYLVFNRSILGLAIGSTLLVLFIYRKRILAFFSKPRQKKMIPQLIAVFLVFCILAMLNNLSLKFNQKYDFTKDKLHSLSDQSLNVLKNIDSPLSMQIVASRGEWDRYMSILKQYDYSSNFISVSAIDIESNPGFVKSKNITDSGTLILKYKDQEIISKVETELDITNLIFKALKSRQINIYYTVGHGELDRNSDKNDGVLFLFNEMKNANYALHPIDLLKIDKIPMNADILLILAPKSGFLDMEVNKIQEYLKKGGNALFSLPPLFFNEDLGNLYTLIKMFGIEIENKIVLDRLATMQGSDASVPIVNSFNQKHSITQNFTQRVLFPVSSSLLIHDSDQIKLDVLAQTSAFPASWAESDLKNINEGTVFFNDEFDTKGPINLMVASEHREYLSKVIVLASAGMIVNAYKSQSPNFNLFLNALAWLSDDEGIISLNRPSLKQELIILSAQEITLIFYFSIILLPFIFFLIAIWMYRRRNNQ